jgi:hypothetical protein
MYDIIMDMLKNDPVERISSSQVVERISNIEWWQEQFIPLPPGPLTFFFSSQSPFG